MTIVEFLLARIAEDERAASKVAPLGHNFDMGGRRQDERFTHGRMGYASADGYPRGLPDAGEGVHFARHDPARVLAECAAKRAIATLHGPVEDLGWKSGAENAGNEYLWCGSCGSLDDSPEPFPCGTLRHLAAVYAYHPDYDEEWRP